MKNKLAEKVLKNDLLFSWWKRSGQTLNNFTRKNNDILRVFFRDIAGERDHEKRNQVH